MTEQQNELLTIAREIRELLRLLAEPAITERDRKLRDKLRQLIGSSERRKQSVLLMDGTRTQKEIITATSIHKGDLSTLVGKLSEANLLVGNLKYPKLAISIPSNFFETNAEAE